jgi:NADH-quinone oxidoreductase subunit G
MGRAARVYYGRIRDGQLESPFSGNLLDICPTGVFTDKTARFRARYWDYDMAPSVCPHCSLGCNTVPAARYRELLKTIARRNDAINGWFICDKGRFSNSAVNATDRPRQPLVDGRETTWDEALEALRLRINETCEVYGAQSLAVVGSSRLSLEAASVLSSLASGMEAGSLCYFVHAEEAEQTQKAIAHLNEETSASMADVQAADLIAITGCRLLDEGPMMALAIRQAWRNGAKIYLIENTSSPGADSSLPFEYESISSLKDVPLAEAARPVIVCGLETDDLNLETSCEKGAKLAFLMNGPNAFGAALLSTEHPSTPFSLAVSQNKVKGVIAVEADIESELLRDIPFVAALDWRNTDTVKTARIVLPTTAWVEMDGTYINNEGRAQRFKKVMNPGLPIKGLDPAVHPPRQHSATVPGGDVKPAEEIITAVIEQLGKKQPKPLAGKWEILRDLDAEGTGRLIFSSTKEINT